MNQEAASGHTRAAGVGLSVINKLAERQQLRYGILGVVGVLAIWEAISRLGLVKTVLISRPTDIVTAAIQAFSTGSIWADIGATLFVFVVGFTISSVLGIGIGLTSGFSRRFRYVADQWLNASNVIPDLAIVPLLIVWFGVGLTFKVVLVVLVGTFYVAINTLTGVKSAEGRFMRVGHSFGASRMRVVRTVILPGSLPYIITGLRQSAARSIIAVIAAEFISGNQGIGFFISLSGSFEETANVMLGILLLGALSIGVNEAFGWVERRLDTWRPAVQ